MNHPYIKKVTWHPKTPEQVKADLLETIDLEVFLDHHWPGEWEKLGDKGVAFDWLTEGMDPPELIRKINESGARE